MTLYILTKTPKQTVNCAMLEVPATKHDRDLFFQLLGPTSDVTDFFREETTVDRFADSAARPRSRKRASIRSPKIVRRLSLLLPARRGRECQARGVVRGSDGQGRRAEGWRIHRGSVRQRRRYQQGRPIPPDTPLARLGQHPTRFGPAPVALRQWCEAGHGQPAAHPLHPRRKHTVLAVLVENGAIAQKPLDSLLYSVFEAPWHTRVKMLGILLDNGASLSRADGGRNSVIGWAAWRNDTECVKFLLKTGANPDAPLNLRRPLYYAVSMKISKWPGIFPGRCLSRGLSPGELGLRRAGAI